MITTRDTMSLSYNLTFLTNYFLTKFNEKQEEISKPVLVFNDKPLIVKYINKIVFIDKSQFKESEFEQYEKKQKQMDELKKSIIENVNNKEIKIKVLTEIFYFKNQECLFKFIDRKTKKISPNYNIHMDYDYFLKEIFKDKENYMCIKTISCDIIQKIINQETTMFKFKDNKYFLNIENKFRERCNYNNIQDNTNVFDILKTEETKDLIFEMYNLKKKTILFQMFLIDMCYKHNLIKFSDLLNLTKKIIETIKLLFKEKNNFVIEQEINLLSYLIIIIKCLNHNTKISNKMDLINFNNLYTNKFLEEIFDRPNNKYLKFIIN